MAGVPLNFSAVSNVLANYDFVDIISGTGYILIYAGDTVDLKLLSNNTFYSQNVSDSTGTYTGGVSRSVLDIDFDVLLNRPLDLKGMGIVNVPVYFNSGGNTSYFYLKLTLRKWDGATETDIVTNNSTAYSHGGLNAFYMTSTDLDIPLTHFKKGETIRLTVEVWGYTTGGANAYVLVGHDPMNRTAGWDGTGAVPSKLVFQCPVRLNL